MAYGDKRDYPKIDIYVLSPRGALWGSGRLWDYKASTTWAKTCREAKERFLTNPNVLLDPSEVKTTFAKPKGR